MAGICRQQFKSSRIRKRKPFYVVPVEIHFLLLLQRTRQRFTWLIIFLQKSKNSTDGSEAFKLPYNLVEAKTERWPILTLASGPTPEVISY